MLQKPTQVPTQAIVTIISSQQEVHFSVHSEDAVTL